MENKHKNQREQGYSGLNKIYCSYRTRSRNENIKFDLTLDQFKTFTSLPCYYCNKPPSQISINPTRTVQGMENSKYLYNGLDRVNPSNGYYLGNILPCCKTCNYAKRLMGLTEFLQWIEQVYNNSVRK